MCSHLKCSRCDANLWQGPCWVRIHGVPSVPSAGIANKPSTATHSIVPHCAWPPIPAWLGALIGCTAGCQATVWLLETIFEWVLTDRLKKNRKQMLTIILSESLTVSWLIQCNHTKYFSVNLRLLDVFSVRYQVDGTMCYWSEWLLSSFVFSKVVSDKSKVK